jgi:hypothetical protein
MRRPSNPRLRTRQLCLPAIALLAAGLVAARPADAQEISIDRSTMVGLEVDAGLDMLGGDDFDGFDNAAGFEALGSVGWPSGFELGLGAGFSSHGYGENSDLSADITNVFLSGRYRFNYPGTGLPHIHPFLAARAGYSHIGGDAAGRSGFLLGGQAGLEYWFTDEVAAVASGLLHYLSYGEVDNEPDSDISGTQTELRAGLKVRF